MGLRLEWPRSLLQWADAAAVPTQPRQMTPPCFGPPRPWLRSEDADQQWSRPHLPLLVRSRRPVRPAASLRSLERCLVVNPNRGAIVRYRVAKESLGCVEMLQKGAGIGLMLVGGYLISR